MATAASTPSPAANNQTALCSIVGVVSGAGMLTDTIMSSVSGNGESAVPGVVLGRDGDGPKRLASGRWRVAVARVGASVAPGAW